MIQCALIVNFLFRIGSHNTSCKQSTEESVDTDDDEWYVHEIQEFEKEEQDNKIEGIKPSASIKKKLNYVLVELTATVAEVDYEDCQKHDKEMKDKQERFSSQSLPQIEQDTLIKRKLTGQPLGIDMSVAAKANLPVVSSRNDIDHKKVIMCFQGSEDFEAEVSLSQLHLEDESLNEKKRYYQGHQKFESSPDSDATQSGPDSLMEDTGGSSDNILDSSNQEKKNQKQETVLLQQPHQPLEIKSDPSTLPIMETSYCKNSLPRQEPQPCKNSSSTGSLQHSQKPMKPIFSAIEGPITDPASNQVLAEGGNEREEEWDNDDYGSGGYYDENGEWVEAFGYYDENGDWVETGGYYDDNGKWVEYAGYYDENGDWIDVQLPIEHHQENETYQGDQCCVDDSSSGTKNLAIHEHIVATS